MEVCLHVCASDSSDAIVTGRGNRLESCEHLVLVYSDSMLQGWSAPFYCQELDSWRGEFVRVSARVCVCERERKWGGVVSYGSDRGADGPQQAGEGLRDRVKNEFGQKPRRLAE